MRFLHVDEAAYYLETTRTNIYRLTEQNRLSRIIGSRGASFGTVRRLQSGRWQSRYQDRQGNQQVAPPTSARAR